MSEDRETARASVRELIDVTEWLAASLLPGTAKPYTAPQMSAEKRAQLDATARLERVAAGVNATSTPLGESPVPLDLNVMDLLVDIMVAADMMAELASVSARVPRMPAAPSAFTDPVPYLLHVIDLLPAVSPESAVTVLSSCESLVFAARSRLGLVSDGQLLDALCPWCDGRTAKHPVGGAKTLRVRLSRDGEPLIVCESGLCEPPEADVGNWWRGRPAWIQPEWDWLAQRIERKAAS